MNQLRPRFLARLLTLVAVGATLTGVDAKAQCPVTELASGLQLPLGITQSNQDNLIVAETGTTAANTGRISIIDLDGIVERSWTACRRDSTTFANRPVRPASSCAGAPSMSRSGWATS